MAGLENSQIIVYGYPDSPYVARVEWVLCELGYDYDFVKVDITRGDQTQKSYLDIAPTGLIPALKVNDSCLYDSFAIIKYLAAVSAYELYSEDLLKQAEIDAWAQFSSFEVGEPISKLCWQRFWKQKFSNRPGEDKKYCERLVRGLDISIHKLEKRLSETQFLCGDHITLADMMSFPLIVLHQRAKYNLESFPSILRWLSENKNRPSFKMVGYNF